LVYDKEIYQKLRDNGVDDKLSKHVAHLFIRDPLVIFKELLNVDDSESSDHFEVNAISRCIYFLDIKYPHLESSIYQLANNEI
jgi:hypothetical protein